MKRILFFILLAVCFKISNSQTVTTRSGQASASLQAVQINSLNATLKDGANTAISRLTDIYTTDYASTNHLSNIYFNGVLGYDKYSTGKLDSLITYTRYNNNKQDSMLSSTSYTTMTFTVTSANTNSAVVANQTIGNGTYSITIGR